MFQKTPTKRVLFVRSFLLTLLVVAGVFASFAFSLRARVSAATSSTINFQARLENTSGAIAPDGNYNVQFQLYSGSSCVPATGSGCTSVWSETYQNSNSQGVTVVNGYLTVNLGSITALPTNLDYSQQLWLSMNIGGTSTSTSPVYDGVMKPYLSLTAVPYAFKAGQATSLSNTTGTYSSTLNLVQPASGNEIFQIPDQGSAGTFNLLTTTAANSGYIQNQTGSTQTAGFNVNGTGTAGTFNATTALQTAGVTRVDNSGNLTNIGNISGTGTLQLSGTTGSSYIMSALGLGTTNPQSGSVITIANSSWISSVDSSGTGYVNLFQVNSSNQIQVGAALNVDGGIVLPTDGGQLTFSDLPIDTSASVGTPESYTFRVGSGNVLTVYGEADGSGNLQNGRVAIGSSIAPQYTLDVGGDINTTGNYRVGGNVVISSAGALQSAALTGSYSNALTFSNASNVFYGSGANLTALNASNISSGTANVAYGGTGANSFTQYGVLVGNGTGAVQVTAAGGAGQCLVSQANGNPYFSSCSGAPVGNAGGDLTGSYPNPTINKLQGTTVTTSSVVTGQVLEYNGTAWVNTTSTGITGTGALTSGSIASGFGTISTASNITTTATVQGGTVNATSAIQTNSIQRIDANGNLTNIGSIATTGSLATSANSVTTYENVYSYGTSSSTKTGTLEIVLPNGWNNTMLRFSVSGYDFSTVAAWHAIISGYNYTGDSSWHYPSAEVTGAAPFSSIRLAYDSSLGKAVLLLGTTSTTWNYPQFSIDEVLAGYSNQTSWGSGYSSAFLTSESNITAISSPVVQVDATSTNAYIQGGNSFGAAAVLGTNDSNSLQIRTAGTTRFTIDTSGNGTLTGNLTVQGTGTSSVGGTLNVGTALQTGGTQRLDASGNLTNINNITASGTVTAGFVNVNNQINLQASSASSELALNYSGKANANLNFYNGSGISLAFINGTNGNTTLTGNLAVNGGNVTTSSSTLNLFNVTPTTVNAFGNASTINIGASGSTTTFAGSLSTSGTITSTSGVLTIQGTGTNVLSGSLTVNGTAFVNAGSTLNTSKSLGNFSSGGSIGANTATVDIYTSFAIAQTTSGQTLTLPSPTVTTAGRVIYISNTGSVNFTLLGVIIAPNNTAIFLWNGSAWTSAGIDGSGTNYIQNQTASAQTAGFNINGSGTIGGSLSVGGQTVFSATGILQPAAISSSVSYSNLTQVGALVSGSIASGFGAISTANNISTTATLSGSALSVGLAGQFQVSTAGNLSTSGTATVATNSTNAFRIQSAGGSTTLLNADTSNNRISIGTNGTATSQLYVAGNIPSAALGSVTTGSGSISTAVQGRYAYVINYTAGTLQVIDISNPASPAVIGSLSLGTQPSSISLSGKYAYITNYGSNTLQVIDISNPASPTSVGSISTGASSNPHYVTTQGRYAYVVNGTSNTFQIFDISNPASPTNVGSISTGASSSPWAVSIQGRYAYVVNSSSNTLQVIDISNPASPTSVGSATTGTGPQSIIVQGRYAYVVNGTSNTFQIFDISNPASPTSVGSATTGTGPFAVSVQGRYAYVTNANSNSLQVFDISNPASPTSVGSVATGQSPRILIVQGRYAYVPVYTSNVLQVFDLGGSYIQQLEAGGAEVGQLSVDGNSSFAGSAAIQGGLQVGQSLQTGGDIGIGGNITAVGNIINSGNITSGGTVNIQGTGTNTFSGTITASSTGTSIFGNGSTGTIQIGDGTISKTSGQGFVLNSSVNASNGLKTGTLNAGQGTLRVDANGNLININNISASGNTTLANTSTTALQIQTTSGASTLLTADTQNNRISIGSIGTPTGQLYVSGMLPTSATGSTSITAGAQVVAVQGRYVFVGGGASATSGYLNVYDETNPAAPSLVGTMSFNYPVTSISIVGRYAYVFTWNSSNSGYYWSQIDITRPASMSLVGNNGPLTSSTTAVASSFAANGEVYGTASNGVVGFDFTGNTPTPFFNAAGTLTNGSGLYVQGKYVYALSKNGSSSTLNVFDLTLNSIGNVAVANNPNAVYVQGRYAYIVNNSGSLQVVDISNPASPSVVATYALNGNAQTITVLQRYAYVTISGSNVVQVVDISNPASPVSVGSIATGSAPAGLAIEGRYGYVINATSNTLQSFDLGGTYTQTLEAGSGELGQLTVNGNSNLTGSVSVGGGLQVAQGLNVATTATINGTLTVNGIQNTGCGFTLSCSSTIFSNASGSTSNTISFAIAGTQQAEIDYSNGGSLALNAGSNTGSGTLFFGNHSGSGVQIGASGNRINLTVYGTSGTTCTIGNSTSATMCSSDARLKTNVVDLGNSLNDILALRPVTFNWKDPSVSQTTHIGFIAQEVQQVFPDSVGMEANGYYGLDYASLVTPAIGAIQQQQTEISGQGSQIATLNSQVAALSTSVSTGSLSVSGGTTLQGTTSVNSNLNVTGATSLSSLIVSGDTQLSGDLSVSGNISADNLNVNVAVISGNLSVAGLTSVNDILVAGHLLSQANAPTVVTGSAAGKDGTVTVDGTDTAGTLTVTVTAHQPTSQEAQQGMQPEVLASGDLADVTFAKAYQYSPRVVISPDNSDSIGLPVYITKDTNGFHLVITSAAQTGKTYQFDYFVISSNGTNIITSSN